MEKTKIVTVSIPSKCVKSLEEVCKILGGTVTATEYSVMEKLTLKSWQDVVEYIEAKLGPSYHKSEDFMEKLIRISPYAAASFLITLIEGYNNEEDKSEQKANIDYLFSSNDTDFTSTGKAVRIIKDKFLPLLHGKGK